MATAAKKSSKKKATKKTAAKKTAGTAKRGIGEFIKTQLKGEPSNIKIAEAVLKKFPGAKTNAACVAWYRSQGKK